MGEILIILLLLTVQ